MDPYYNNQSPYPNPGGPFGMNPSPYPGGPSGMPTADFSVNQTGGYPNPQFAAPFSQGGYPPQPGPYPSQPGPYPSQPSYPYSQQPAGPYPQQTPDFYQQQSGPYPQQTPGAYSQNPQYPQYPTQFASAPAAQYPIQGGYQNVIPNAQQESLYPNLGQPGSAPHVPPPANYVPEGANQYFEGTIRPVPNFNPVDDAQKLYKAMKGFGTDETTLIDILCKRTNQQRMQIVSHYKTNFGKDLLKDVIKETSGNFENVLVALLTPTVQYEAAELKEAINGAGTDEVALLDIICTKSNQQMIELRNVYRQMFHKDMEKDVRGDVSGYFQRILVSLLNGNRSEAPADLNKARQQAKELYEAGEKRLGTNEVKFNQIFAAESYAQLRLVFEEYYKLTGHDIDKAIRKEMSGDVENAFLAIAQIAKHTPGYFAERLYKSMKGAGTYDRTLIRNVVLRSEIDMREIKVEFQKKYSKTLESFIKGDVSGDYRRALLCLIGDENWRKA